MIKYSIRLQIFMNEVTEEKVDSNLFLEKGRLIKEEQIVSFLNDYRELTDKLEKVID